MGHSMGWAVKAWLVSCVLPLDGSGRTDFSDCSHTSLTVKPADLIPFITYQRRRRDQTRVVKTPGGKLVYQYTKKRASGPKCPVTGKKIQGIPHLRPGEYKRSRLSRNRRVYSSLEILRIIRAFLVEEQKIVKKVLKIQKTKDKTGAK